jgi:hypothetical protein
MGIDAGRVFTVGYLEQDDASIAATAFDAVVRTPPAPRADPCIEFLRRASGK